MRVTIIPRDGFVAVDGIGFNDIDMASVDASIHAMQWYGDHGEIEIKSIATGKIVKNELIRHLDAFSVVMALFDTKKAAYDAGVAEQALLNEIVEV